MKKILFLAICFLTVAGSVSAQGYYGPRRVRRAPPHRVDEFYKVKVGITGSVNFANAVDGYNSDYSTDGIVGFNAGLFLDIPVVYPLSAIASRSQEARGQEARAEEAGRQEACGKEVHGRNGRVIPI